MKFLVIGLGSMGKRRIRNLQFLKAGEIIGFDPREDRRKETEEKYGIKTFKDFETAMRENPDVLIISTPPDRHMEYAIIAAQKNKHFFVEASVIDDDMDKLIDLCKGEKIVAVPSCTMRFHPTLMKIKELIDSGVIGKPLVFSYHFGQYFPEWHPWEDYRKFYAANKRTGGCREEVAFELVWATWMFGDVDTISCFRGKLTKLDVEIDDVYQIIIKFKNDVFGHLLVNVIARDPYRAFKILGEKGTIEWDWGTKKIRAFTAKNKKWIEYPSEEGDPAEGYVFGEKMYINEIAHFLGAIKGDVKYRYTFEEDKKNLGLLYAAERSSDKGVHVNP